MFRNSRKKLFCIVILCLTFVLGACSSNRNTPDPEPLSFETLDRRQIVDELVRINDRQIVVPHNRGSQYVRQNAEYSTFIILDDCVYMGNFLRVGTYTGGNNTFENILRTLDSILPSSYYYKLSEGGLADPVPSRFLFTNARDIEFYRRSDSIHLSPLSSYMYEFLNIHYVNEESQLFLLVTDMNLSGGTDDSGFPDEFVALLSRFIKSRYSTVGVIGIQAEYLGNISAMPCLVLDDNGDIVGRNNTNNTVNRFHVNYGNSIHRPVYLLFMGDSGAVRHYIRRFEERFPNAENLMLLGKYQYFIFDEIPSSLPAPSPTQLSTIVPILNDALLRYAVNADGMLHLVSDSLIGTVGFQGELIAWDNHITDHELPFWRIYSGFRESASLGAGHRPGLTLNIGSAQNAHSFYERITIKMLNSEGNWTDNASSHIYMVEDRALPNQIIFELIPSSFADNKPVLFVVDVEQIVMNDVAYRFQRFSDKRWIDEWSLDLRIFRDEAYFRNNDGAFEFILWTPPDIAAMNYSQAHRTPFLNSLFDMLLTMRTEFIQDTLYYERIAYTSHQYAIFGFVARNRYVTHSPNALNNETGGFAFSVEEVRRILDSEN